jgi:hypothetical protein
MARSGLQRSLPASGITVITIIAKMTAGGMRCTGHHHHSEDNDDR